MTNGSEKSISSRTLSALLWVSAGAGMQIAIKLAVLVVLARLLTPTEFGLFTISTIVLTFMQVAGRFGVGPALVQSPKIGQEHISTGFMISLGFSLIVAVIVFFSAPIIATFFDRDELIPILWTISAIPLLQGVSQISESLLQRDLAFRRLTLIDGTGHLLGYGLTSIVLASLGFGVWSLVIATLVQDALRCALLLWNRGFSIRPGFSLTTAAALVRFGAGISLVQAMNVLAYQLDNLVVARVLGTDAVGAYGRAYQILTMPTKLLGNTLLKVLFPAMSLVQADSDRLGRALHRALGVTFLLTLPLSIFISVFAPEIVFILLGGQWDQVIAPIQILSLAIVFRVGQKSCEAAIRASGHVYRLFLHQLAFAVSVLVLSYVGSSYGLSGVAAGVLLSSAFNFLSLLYLALKTVGLGFVDLPGILLRPVAASTILLAMILPFSLWSRSVEVHPALILVLPILIFALAFALIITFARSLLGPDLEKILKFVREKF